MKISLRAYNLNIDAYYLLTFIGFVCLGNKKYQNSKNNGPKDNNIAKTTTI